MKWQPKYFIYLFWLLAIFHIVVDLLDQRFLLYLSKPPLMLLLAGYFYTATRHRSSLFTRTILIALVFASIGDTLLMFRDIPPATQNMLFLGGLIGFLITHICYTLAFWNRSLPIEKGLSSNLWVIPIFFLNWIGFNYLLWPSLGEMRLPVIIYSMVITLMAISVFRLRGFLSSRWFSILLVGILLFMISDSLIAVNRFMHEIQLPAPRLLIMSTYLLGQYLIVLGCKQIAELIEPN